MADITVKLTGVCDSNHPVYNGSTYNIDCNSCIVYTIRNICTLTYQMDSPVQIIPIPETQVNWTGVAPINCEGSGPIALKIEGNQATISVVWTINDEATTVVSGGKNDIGCAAIPTVSTAENQVEFLLTAFQNRSINYRYEYNGGGLTNVGVLMQKMTMTLEGRSPIIYRGEMTLAVGDIITTVSEG